MSDAEYGTSSEHMLVFFPIGEGIVGRESVEEFLVWLDQVEASPEVAIIQRKLQGILRVNKIRWRLFDFLDLFFRWLGYRRILGLLVEAKFRCFDRRVPAFKYVHLEIRDQTT